MKKISRKLSIMIICCSCISVLLVSAVSIFEVVKLVKYQNEEGLVRLAQSYASQFNGELMLIENNVDDIYIHLRDTIDTDALARDPDYLAQYEDELAKFIQRYANEYTDSISAYCYFNPKLSDEPHDVYYVDGNGDGKADRQAYIPFSYYNNIPEPDDDKYWWYGPTQTGNLVWTNPYEWTLVNNKTIKVVSCAKPVYVEGQLIAVVGIYYRFGEMNSDISSIKVLESGYASLVNDKLDFIVHPSYFTGNRNNSDSIYTVEDGQLAGLANELLASDSGVLSYTLDGQPKVMAYASLCNGWKMLLNPVISEMYASIITLTWRLLLLLIIITLLSIVAARKLGERFAKPILTMVDATREISSGNFDVRVDLDTNDEISELADSFNEMVGSITSLNNELITIAYFDTLTGMGNKSYFERGAAELLASGKQCYAYVLLDINNFKLVNDLFGMERGDLLLQHIATVLGSDLELDELAARFNADRFHMLYCYDGRTQLEQRLQKISEQITAYAIDSSSGYKLSVGFGVYVVDEEAPVVSLIGDKAKLALDKIKGSHTFALHFYNDNIRNKILEEKEIENSMEQALANHEFKVYLQPKYNPYTNKIVGSEALVRWVHPQKGIIPPDQFIPVFERNGFILDLDKYMLGEVCKLIHNQLHDGVKPMLVSVNQSRQYLNVSDYLQTLGEILSSQSIPPRLIELEITETAFFKNQDEMIKVVKQLHDIGFTVSLDDFGSGYSSFNMLQDIMVDVLKIDKNFFRDSVNSDRGKKIVANIVTMAHELNMLVVAEGVETAEQVEFLNSTNCDVIQGYYYSRPLPSNEIDQLWRKQVENEQAE